MVIKSNCYYPSQKYVRRNSFVEIMQASIACPRFYSKQDYKVRLVHNNTLSDTAKLGKDKTRKLKHTGVVYKIPCNKLRVAIYIGQSKRSKS